MANSPRNGARRTPTTPPHEIRAARLAVQNLKEHNRILLRHTEALAKGNRRLEREIARRQAGEVIIRSGREHFQNLLIESQGMQKRLRSLTHQVMMAQEEERKHISRELHDGVVQLLIGINVELSALGVAGASRQLQARIARTKRLVQTSVEAVHRFARELRPAALDDLGLIPALHSFCNNLAERKRIQISITAFRGVEALAGTKRTVLFRVAQEALTNVARHAGATRARIDLTQVAGRVRMDISDNGRSFEVAKFLSKENPSRLGLIGMRERIEIVGGSLDIESTPGTGTRVRVEIPFTPEKTKS